MSQEAITKEIECDTCHEKYPYNPATWIGEDGILNESCDEMPDGYLYPNYTKEDWDWVCDKCGSCPNCGKSLEKEPEKRARMKDGKLELAKMCEECKEEENCPGSLRAAGFNRCDYGGIPCESCKEAGIQQTEFQCNHADSEGIEDCDQVFQSEEELENHSLEHKGGITK